SQSGRRDVVDGLLRAREREEVRVARRPEVGRRWPAARGRDGDATTVNTTVVIPRSAATRDLGAGRDPSLVARDDNAHEPDASAKCLVSSTHPPVVELDSAPWGASCPRQGSLLPPM